jgi:hypothetical protein
VACHSEMWVIAGRAVLENSTPLQVAALTIDPSGAYNEGLCGAW